MISGPDLVVLLAVAAVVLGPERLPSYAHQLAQLIRQLRRMAAAAQDQVREELGPEFDEVDWRALDPRRYDPRRIVRDALTDVMDVDDPLALGRDPLGLGGDPLGLKPVSPGGPTVRLPRPAAGGPEPVAPDPTLGAPSGDPESPAFDPDAT